MEGIPFTFCVDLDGVVCDYTTAFREFVADVKNVDPASLSEQTSWSFVECDWGISSRDEYYELHNAAVEAGMFATMPAIEGASEALWYLNDEWDVHVRIVTHRLISKGAHSRTVSDTVAWLDQLRDDGRPLVPYTDLAFLGRKPQIGGDTYLDDAPHNIAALREAGADAIVFSAPYNRHVDGPRANNWDQVVEAIEARIRWAAADPRRVA